jgi:hypothetical protein
VGKTIFLKTAFVFALSINQSYAKAPKAKQPSHEYTNPYTSGNGSSYNDISPRTYKQKNQYVNDYYHKDGSRVRSYYRSKKKG